MSVYRTHRFARSRTSLGRKISRAALMGSAATAAISLGAVQAAAQQYDREYHGTVSDDQIINTPEDVLVASDGTLTGQATRYTLTMNQGGALTVEGQILTPTQPAPGAVRFSGDMSLRVGKSGHISGAEAIYSDSADTVRIDNAGTIDGNVTISGQFSYVEEFRNRASGKINGGVRLPERAETFINEGLIDSGDATAVALGGQSVINTGTIRNNSETQATVGVSVVSLVNAGLIEAAGGSPAVSITGDLINQAGGRIAGVGRAVNAFGNSNLDNAGTIDGDVAFIDWGRNIVVQRSGGVINGDLSLGDDNDQFYVTAAGDVNLATVDTGVRGSVDGGAGTDVYGVLLSKSGTITLGGLPSGFERFGIRLCNCTDVTATIAEGAYTAPLYIDAQRGTVVNNADLSYTGDLPIVGVYDETDRGDGPVGFVNRGTLTATKTVGGNAIDMYASESWFQNDGEIALDGKYGTGIYLSQSRSLGLAFSNSGSIISNGTDASLAVYFGGNGRNSGTITANGDTQRALNFYYGAFTNEAGGSITAGGAALTMISSPGRPYSAIFNAGTIKSVNADAIVLDAAALVGYEAMVVNEASGIIEGATAIRASRRAGNPKVGGQIAILNRGRMTGAVDLSEAASDDIFWAAEGSHVEGDVLLGGGKNTLAVDLSRYHADGSVDMADLVSGGVSVGTELDNKLQLVATQSRSANILSLNSPLFNSLVYDAYGAGTVLSLTGPLDADGEAVTVSDAVRVSGNGTVAINADFDFAGRGGYGLYAGVDASMASIFDGPAELYAPVNVVFRGAFVGAADGGIRLGNANLRLSGTATIDAASGSAISIEDGAFGTVTLDKGAQIHLLSSGAAKYAIAGGLGPMTIVNAGRIFEDAYTGTTDGTTLGYGVAMNFSSFTNTIDGVVSVMGTGIQAGAGSSIDNAGLIESGYSAAVKLTDFYFVDAGGTLINSGTLRGYTRGAIGGVFGATVQGSSNDDVVDNSGAIEGDVALGGGADIYRALGGTVTGSVDLGDDDDTLLVLAGKEAGVSGAIVGGQGQDAFGTSFDVSGDLDLSTIVLPADFEMYAAEARGGDVSVTLADGGAPSSKGVRLLGSGTIVNNAAVAITDPQAESAAIEAEGNLALENNATISTTYAGILDTGLRSFLNRGSITSQAGAYSREADTLDQAFLFVNEGTMRASDGSAVSLYVRAASGAEGGAGPEIVALDFRNSGQIISTGEYRNGVQAHSDGGVLQLANLAGGEISSSGAFSYGMDISGEDRAELSNAGLIEASGENSIGVFISSSAGAGGEDCPPGEAKVAIALSNAGVIRANNGITATAVNLQSDADYSLIRLINAAGGVIETSGDAGTAVAACAVGEYSCGSDGGGYGEVDVDAALRFFEMTNAGTVTGNGGFESAAIFSTNLTDTIANEATGVINGYVGLNEGDDVFTNKGTINGDIDMGEGDDTFVYYASGSMNGTAYGGDGNDALIVDLSGSGLIDFDLFRQFETLGQRGAGTITIKGSTDLATLNIAGSNITVAEGTMFQSAGALALQGSDGSETLTIAGRVVGDVDLGGGDDTVNLTGTGSLLEGNGGRGILYTGAGNDIVVATGPIRGIYLGEGDDRLLLQTGAYLSRGTHAGAGNDVVTVDGNSEGDIFLEEGDDRLVFKSGSVEGTIDGGDGTDTVAFEMTADTNSAPGNLVSFEILEASGAHRLTLTPAQRYEEILLRNGADLTLNVGDPLFSVGKVTGDDSDNDVVLGVPLTGGVSLGGGSDTLTMSLGGALTNDLDGGDGQDTLALDLTGEATIGGSVKGFEHINVAGGAKLTLAGDLAEGQTMTFDGNDNHLSVTGGGALYGSVDGGAGEDRLTFDTVAGATTSLGEGTISNFEIFEVTGDGTLALTASRAFETLEMNQASLALAQNVTFTGDVLFGATNNVLTLETGAKITGTADGGAGTDRLQLNQAAGDMRKLSDVLGSVVNFEQLGIGGAGSLQIDVDQGYTGGVVMTGGTLDVLAGHTLSADVRGEGNSNDTLVLGGMIAGSVSLGAGNDRLVLQGGTATGGIDGGEGTDTVAFTITRDEAGIPNVTNFENLDVSGGYRLTIGLDQNFDTIYLNDGADLTLNPGAGDHTIGSIVGDGTDQDVLINTRLTGGVDLGGGNDRLTLQLEGALAGGLDGGAGDDTLNLTLTGAASINGGAQGFEHINVAGASPLTLGGEFGAGQTMQFDGGDNTLIIDTGAHVLGSIDGGAGTDTLSFTTVAAQTTVLGGQITGFEIVNASGAGTVAVNANATFDSLAINGGDLAIGAGATLTAPAVTFDDADNRFTIGENATFSGRADGGAGIDRLVLNQATSQVRKMSTVDALGFEQLETGGAGELAFDVDASFALVDMLGGKLSIAAGKTLTAGAFSGGDGANILDVRGTLKGDVDLGAGDDRLIVASAGAVTGTRSGGLGTDTLEFAAAGTVTAPSVWNGAGFESFERLAISSGVVSLTGDASYENVSVTGGRLIGQAGTTITSTSTIQVAQGATFGTAGTVKGNIRVFGTLAPGASPGTMNVIGDVAFEAGSTLAMEVASPTSDKLLVSGKLAIADGARMDITGILQSGAGGSLDLVVANGGITGMFTTINKSDTIFGYVVKRDNKIQIAGTFAGAGNLPYNAAQAVAYGNATVSAGQMVQAFTAGLPALVNADGTAKQAGFQQLGPEAYASAGQMAVDTGLAVADAGRNLRTPEGVRGLFGFAAGLASWSDHAASRSTGATATDGSVNGLLGGIGFGFERGQVGAFVASQRGRQTLGDLGANTKSDGAVLGAFARADLGSLEVRALAAVDLSKATTHRRIDATADGESSVGKYGLGGLTLDLSVAHSFDLGKIKVAPMAGTTFVEGKRGGVTETGTPFALRGAGASQNAWFGDAGIKLTGTFAAVQPYAEIGVRHMFRGGETYAEAGMTGSTVTPLMGAYGVDRDRTTARLGAGLGADLAANVRLSVGYVAEVGKQARHTANAGISVGF